MIASTTKIETWVYVRTPRPIKYCSLTRGFNSSRRVSLQSFESTLSTNSSAEYEEKEYVDSVEDSVIDLLVVVAVSLLERSSGQSLGRAIGATPRHFLEDEHHSTLDPRNVRASLGDEVPPFLLASVWVARLFRFVAPINALLDVVLNGFVKLVVLPKDLVEAPCGHVGFFQINVENTVFTGRFQAIGSNRVEKRVRHEQMRS